VLSVVLGTRIFEVAWWGWALIAAVVIVAAWLARAAFATTTRQRSTPPSG
jgi:hypothetical protein